MALFKRRNRYLGIDISPSAIKLIELSRNGQRFQIDAIAIEPIPDGAVQNRNPADLDQVCAALRRAVKASGTGLRTAAVAVPTSSVITRTMPMPAPFGEDEIEASIQIEASQYIPFPLEEIYLDFQSRGLPAKGGDTQEVMLVASRKENVDLREEVLREAGLKAAIVDVEAYALENAFALLGRPAGPTALVDIGAAITTLYVVQDQSVVFAREQPFGGNQLTQAIADTYGLSRERAELAKRSGELSEDYPNTILAPFKQTAAEQIGNALQFFFSSSHYNAVANVVLVGGGAMVSGIDQVVSELLGIPAVVGNPFEQMGSGSRVNRRSLLRDAPLFAVACGLALRSFD